MSFNGKVRIEGLDEALQAMLAAFPVDARQQRKLLNQSMSQAAKPTITRAAKSFAEQSDGSGALAHSIRARAVSASRARARGVPSSVQIVPVRKDKTAIAMYINHYYPNGAPPSLLTGGLRHGHLVEFGHKTKNGGFVAARPFMWPAVASQSGSYVRTFAKVLKRKVELAVKRKRRK